MSSGLKIGLIVAGAGLVGLLILRSSAAAATTTSTPSTSGGLLSLLGLGGVAPAPAGPSATPVTTALSTTPGAPTSTSGISRVASGLWSVDKSIVGGAYNAAKSADKAVIGGVSSVVHSVFSIF